MFAFALIHELLRMDRIDLDYLVRYANAHWLVVRNPGGADDGLFARDAEGNPLCWDHGAGQAADANLAAAEKAKVVEALQAIPGVQLAVAAKRRR